MGAGESEGRGADTADVRGVVCVPGRGGFK